MSSRRRNREEWQSLLEQFSTSNDSVEEFCAALGMSPNYFRKKRAQLKRMAKPGAFVRAQRSAPEPITIQIQDVQVRCTAELPVVWVAELAAALRR